MSLGNSGFSLRSMGAAAAVTLGSLLCVGSPAMAQQVSADADWPQFLGSNSNLRIDAPELEAAGGSPTVDVRWRRPIGPGYSQPIVGRGVTYIAYSDDTNDVLAALSVASGAILWRYTIGPTWRGVDGSDDGPISSPTLGEGVVIGLGPRGQLFALDTASGKQRWRVDLRAEHGAKPGNYGFATSPLLVNGLVIVQIGGGAGKSVAAFDIHDGRLAWSAGDDAVAYQSPLVATLQGVRQLLTVTSTKVSGLEPNEGTLLWTASYLDEAQNHSNPVVVTGPDSFVIANVDDSAAFRLEHQSGSYAVHESWRSRELKRSYSYPVSLGAALYGWSGDFFAAIDAGTGNRHWKTRGVGPGSLIALGDWLAIWTVDGRLLFVEPTTAEYRQVSEFQLVDVGTLVNPVWTGDGLLLRGRDELLAVDVGVTDAAASEIRTTGLTETDLYPGGRMAKLLSDLERASDDEKQNLVTAFLDSHAIPLVEDDGTVTFLYDGEADDVALVRGGIPVESAVPMTRVGGTDLWFRIERLNRKGAYPYRYEIDGERPSVDPRNDVQSRNIMPSSLLLMPDFEWAPALAPGATEPSRKGTLTDFTFESEVMGNERNVTVYTPAGYDENEALPLVLVTSGMDRFLGRMPRILDAAMGRTVEPAIVVLVDIAEPVDMNIFYESLGGRGPLFTRMLVEELLPWIEGNYEISERREDRLIMGTLLMASRALDTALRHPQLFGAVAVQSPNMNAAFERELDRVLEDLSSPPRVYIDWCEHESVAHAEGMDVKPSVERVVKALRQAELDVTARELPGGYGWEMFSTQTEAILARFLPVRSSH